MILNAFTVFHVVLSLIGIGSGVVAIYELLKATTPGRWTKTFLATTAATTLTGFLFPFHGVTPAQVLGVRVPALSAMAPTQSEPPFQVAQLAVLLLFAAIGIRAATAKPQPGLVP